MNRLIYIVCAFVSCCAYAQEPRNLQEVIKSPEMHHLKLQIKKHQQRQSKDWREADTNFARLFKSGGGKLLLQWLTPSRSDDFIPKTTVVRLKERYVMAAQKYLLNKTHEDILMTIIVPSPDHLTSVEMGIFQEIARFSPPHVDAAHSENLELQGLKAALYFTPSDSGNGRCSLLVNLSRGAVLNLEAKVCKEQHILTKLVDLFNLKNLDEKLNS